MKTFNTEDSAVAYMRAINKARQKAGNGDIVVVVDGPEEATWSVMELKEAVENGFFYRWEI